MSADERPDWMGRSALVDEVTSLRADRTKLFEHLNGKCFKRGYVTRKSDGSMRSETDTEFRARILRDDTCTPGLLDAQGVRFVVMVDE